METNWGHWKKRIKEIEEIDGVAIVNNIPQKCFDTACTDCLRYKIGFGCSLAKSCEWKDYCNGKATSYKIKKFYEGGYPNLLFIPADNNNYKLKAFKIGQYTFKTMEAGREYTVEELIGEEKNKGGKMKTNIEKYQKELADIALYNSTDGLTTNFGVDKRDNTPKECNKFNVMCDNCLFMTPNGCECSTKTLKWSLDTESLLDGAEKRFLKNIVDSVIDEKGDHITGISKEEYTSPFEDMEVLHLCVGNVIKGQLPGFIKGTMYKNLEAGKTYSVEELGLK